MTAGPSDGTRTARVVRPRKARRLLTACGLAGAALSCLWIAATSDLRRGPAMLALGSVFFAVGAVSVGADLLPSATELHSTGTHLEMRKHFRTSSIPWSACGPFSVIRIGNARHVVFDLAPPHRPTGVIGALNAEVVGRNAFVDFDYPAEELCRELEAWRREALGNG